MSQLHPALTPQEFDIEAVARKLCELRGIDPDWLASVGLSPLRERRAEFSPQRLAAEEKAN